ncbi:MAG TPA: hypothetical protein VHK91_15775, partial [Flavisolibacter sp.]|nr:hypothetical protein [Flavisolibacter sp.]
MIAPVKNGLVWLALLLLIFSCKKENYTTRPEDLLAFTADTLHFDTVFTTTGSTSRVLKIINDHSKAIQLDAIRLAGGVASAFRINADGQPGPEVHGLEIAGNDSVYVFVSVHINPNMANLAFLVQDSLSIEYNGNKKWIQLDAFGQNARYLRNQTIQTDEEWTNELPYVILDKLEIAPGARLTIQEGCKIYMHADAPFIINGSLQVNGERYDSTRVVFTGDRLDAPYRSFPASFPGLIFSPTSSNNILNYAIIQNAYQGITVTDPAPGAKVIL